MDSCQGAGTQVIGGRSRAPPSDMGQAPPGEVVQPFNPTDLLIEGFLELGEPPSNPIILHEHELQAVGGVGSNRSNTRIHLHTAAQLGKPMKVEVCGGLVCKCHGNDFFETDTKRDNQRSARRSHCAPPSHYKLLPPPQVQNDIADLANQVGVVFGSFGDQKAAAIPPRVQKPQHLQPVGVNPHRFPESQDRLGISRGLDEPQFQEQELGEVGLHEGTAIATGFYDNVDVLQHFTPSDTRETPLDGIAQVVEGAACVDI